MPLKGANLEHARSLNRRVAFECIYRHGPISRSDVANRTQLTPQTVSNIVAELIPYGLINENNVHTGKKGKPAREYAINKDGTLVIGLHIDQHEVVGRLSNIVGESLKEYSINLDDQAPKYVISKAESVVKKLLQGNKDQRQRLLGVGVAMPGVFKDGVFISGSSLTMKNWQGFALANALSKKIKLPVFVENDATAAAIGEGLFGAAKDVQSFVYVYFGLGLGGGLMLNGSHYSGTRNRAAEIGHIIVDPGGKPCPCGNRGCLERYVSLFSAYQAITESDTEYTAVPRQEILDAFEANDKRLKRWIKTAAKHLHTGMDILDNIIDPQRLFLGGLLPTPVLNELVIETEKIRTKKKTDLINKPVTIKKLEVALDDVSFGAAALPLSVLMNPPAFDHTGLDYVRPTEGESLYNLLTGN